MMMPTVAEERAIALARKYKSLAPRLRTGWKSNGDLVSLLFFALTSLAIAATFGFLHLLGLPKGWITCAMAIGLAEWLIRKRRFFGTGVESALWLGGLFAFIFGLPGDGKPEALLLFALASLVAAARVRNALIGALGVLLVVVYLGIKNEDTWLLVISLSAIAVGVVALAREWRRPSTETFLSLLVIGMPVAAYVASPGVLLALAMFVVLLASAIVLRHHALFAASFVSLVLFAIAINEKIELAAEWKLLLAGSTLFATSTLVSRVLRKRTSGFVVGAAEEASPLELIATVQLSPVVPGAAQPATGGGSFGGAGASGNF